MNRSYFDIIERIPFAPIWWQEGGVPRYEEFDPEVSTGVYANEAALAEIACGACETTFLVLCETWETDGSIKSQILAQSLEYGDPPNVGCCPAGATMSSGLIRVVEYWSRYDQKHVSEGRIIDRPYFEWQRQSSLEIKMTDPWGDGDAAPPEGPRWSPNPKPIQNSSFNSEPLSEPKGIIRRIIRGISQS